MTELRQEAEPKRDQWRRWANERIAGLACALVGAASMAAMLIAAASQSELAMLPPLVLTLPPLAVAAGLAVTAGIRRERSWRLPVAGVVAAAAAVVSGWVVVVAAVIAGLAVLFWLVSELAG
jgi:hypothetical protein